MITGIAAGQAAASQSQAARKAQSGQSFLATLSAVDPGPVQHAPPAAGTGESARHRSSMGDPARAEAMRKMEEIDTQHETVGERYAELMRQAFTLVGDATGQPISESVGFRRNGNHFEFFSTRQNNAGPDDDPRFPHPQGDVLSAVFNGTDPALADLTKQVKDLLKQADELFGQLQGLERQMAEAIGGDFTERGLDGDFVFAMPNRFVNEGRAKAAQDPKAFAAFRATLSADDMARLSDEQIYSRFFVRTASKDEMQAALEAEREKKSQA